MKIEIRGLKKAYGSVAAVRELDLTVNEGEFLVILGPSGCGKTTSLRCLAGLEEPDDGVIQIGPQKVFDARERISIPPEGRNIGMVFQSYALWPHMTVFDNVAYPLRVRHKNLGTAELTRRVREVLAMVGLEHLETRSSSMLSGGQMQRVSLARALVSWPAALLLDEPLSNLDMRLRHHLRTELKEIQRTTGATSVYVTHDQTEAASLADRILVMRDGEVEQLCTPEELFSKPASRFVADFLGIPNLFSFRVLRQTGESTYHGLMGDAIEVTVESEEAIPADRDIDCWFRADALELASEEELQSSGDSTGSALRATIRHRLYTGTHYEYRASLISNGRQLDVTIALPQDKKLEIGDTVPLRWKPGQVRPIVEP